MIYLPRLDGTFPEAIDGQVVAAIGVNGASGVREDDDIAAAALGRVSGAAATASRDWEDSMRTFVSTAAVLVLGSAAAIGLPSADTVRHIPGAEVREAFAKGRPLVETPGYKVHASRRDAAGQAEVHTRDTDVFYVLEGRATVVTGGTLMDGKTTAPDEIRGSTIQGGDVRTLGPGDVLVVPGGTPHWFKSVEAPMRYYVVKVTAPASGATP